MLRQSNESQFTMASSDAAAVSAFIEGAPPGEVSPQTPTMSYTQTERLQACRRCDRYLHSNNVESQRSILLDIRKLTTSDPELLQSAKPAFEKYNEEQLTTVKLPGSEKDVS